MAFQTVAAISGITGGAAGIYATGAIGTYLAGSGAAGFYAATGGGIVGGAVGGGTSGFLTAEMQGMNGEQVWGQTWQGAAIGGLFGGAASAISYGLSPAYRWQTHKTVMEWANIHNKLDAAVKYVAGIEGFDPSRFSFNPGLIGDQGSTDMTKGIAEIGPNGIQGNNGQFDPSNLYETVWHEGQHVNEVVANKIVPAPNPFISGVRHSIIYRLESSHQYFKFWSDDVTKLAFNREINYAKFWRFNFLLGY
jgi:hypothetical protein